MVLTTLEPVLDAPTSAAGARDGPDGSVTVAGQLPPAPKLVLRQRIRRNAFVPALWSVAIGVAADPSERLAPDPGWLRQPASTPLAATWAVAADERFMGHGARPEGVGAGAPLSFGIDVGGGPRSGLLDDGAGQAQAGPTPVAASDADPTVLPPVLPRSGAGTGREAVHVVFRFVRGHRLLPHWNIEYTLRPRDQAGLLALPAIARLLQPAESSAGVIPGRFVIEELFENQRGSGLVGPRSFSGHGTYGTGCGMWCSAWPPPHDRRRHRTDGARRASAAPPAGARPLEHG